VRRNNIYLLCINISSVGIEELRDRREAKIFNNFLAILCRWRGSEGLL
jgi:hypothetical protein